MYQVVFDGKAIDFLANFQKAIRKRIYNKIILTKTNPFHFFERLKGKEAYKLRIGNYRVIADIDKNTETIKVILIGHRKNVYKEN